MIWKIILAALQAYLLGSIPFGYVLYRASEGGDVRAVGSGNIGATNVLRGAGRTAAVATLLLDAAKGYVAVRIAALLTGGAPPWVSLAILMVILGHMFPVFLKFRGGKGVATALGAFLAVAPLAALCAVTIFLIIVGAWRYVSLASIIAVAALPLILIILGTKSPSIVAAAFTAAIFIISRHRSNLRRLWQGTESHFSSKRKFNADTAGR